MEELTVEELVKYAVRVQQESFLFYRRAARRLEGNVLKGFTEELADYKAEHLNRLKKLLSDYILKSENYSYLIAMDTSIFDELVENSNIPVQATPRDVLQISFKREENTSKTYEMILNLHSLGKEMLNVFSVLKDMEKQHLRDIMKRIEDKR